MKKQYRNFIGDPFLEACGGYSNSIEEEIIAESRKKNLVGMAFTALMVIGIVVAAGWAYKKIK